MLSESVILLRKRNIYCIMIVTILNISSRIRPQNSLLFNYYPNLFLSQFIRINHLIVELFIVQDNSYIPRFLSTINVREYNLDSNLVAYHCTNNKVTHSFGIYLHRSNSKC